MLTLKADLGFAVAAAHGGIIVRSDEPDEALHYIAGLCKHSGWVLLSWDINHGLGLRKKKQDASVRDEDPIAMPDDTGPAGLMVAVDYFSVLKTSKTNDVVPGVLLVKNLHQIVRAVEVSQHVSDALATLKRQCKTLVGVIPSGAELPAELASRFTMLTHELPRPKEFVEIMKEVIAEEHRPDDPAELCEAACGMTRLQFENALADEHIRKPDEAVTPQFVWKRKCELMKDEGLVRILEPKSGFDGLGGMDGLKAFSKKIIGAVNCDNPDRRANGILLVSAPGVGKTSMAEALAYETGNNLVEMDFGAMRGGLVGDTERMTRKAFETVEAMAPRAGKGSRKVLIVLWDEIEKTLSQGDSKLDSGTGVAQLNYVLKWLSSRQSNTFVLATANEAKNLHPALTRAERLDAVFYVERPTAAQRERIWDIYLKRFGLAESVPCLLRSTNRWGFYLAGSADRPKWVGVDSALRFTAYDDAQRAQAALPVGSPAVVTPLLPADDDWTGAEIKTCCRLAAMMNASLQDAAKHVVPVYIQHRESLLELEKWATGRCLSSETGQRFHPREAEEQQTVRRKVSRLSDKKTSGESA